MAIRSGQILHVLNDFVVDRIQTGGPGDLNIPQEKIRELGNFQSVAFVRDIPELSFNVDKLSVSTEFEALITGSDDPEADTFGTDSGDGHSSADAAKYELELAVPVDIISPWKSGQGAFDIVRGVVIPHLTLESASYRFGLQDNAGEQFTLRGDSIFYTPGTPYLNEFTGDGATTAYNFNDGSATPSPINALKYVEQGNDIFALNVSVDGVRQVHGEDFTDTATGITFTTAPANNASIRVVFASATADNYPQTVHQGVAVKPAAIRGKDIQVYIGDPPVRWTDVQAVTLDWSITVEDDFEFGNPRAVSREASDEPEVTGTVDIMARDPAALFAKLRDITGVVVTDVIGPQSSVTVPLRIYLLNPDTGGTGAFDPGTVLKTFYVPDARFTLPGYEGTVQQKLTQSMSFDSDSGELAIYKGLPHDL